MTDPAQTDDRSDDVQTPEPVDVRNNPESRAADAQTTSRVARASDGGAPPRDAPAAGELPGQRVGALGLPPSGPDVPIGRGQPVQDVESQPDRDLRDAVGEHVGADGHGEGRPEARGPVTPGLRRRTE